MLYLVLHSLLLLGVVGGWGGQLEFALGDEHGIDPRSCSRCRLQTADLIVAHFAHIEGHHGGSRHWGIPLGLAMSRSTGTLLGGENTHTHNKLFDNNIELFA